jgi:hypothetical protein
MHFLVRLVPAERSEPIAVDGSHRMLASINLLPDGLVVTDRDLNILTQNSAFLDLVHLPTPEQANGEALTRFLGRPGVDRNILLENLVKYGVVRNFPTVLQTQFGELEDVEVCAVSVPEGEEGFYGFSIRRVSRREMERGQQPLELVRSPADMSELVGRVSLKEIARLKIRPSTSGKTTFIARSAALAPLCDTCQACFVDKANATCKIGAFADSSTLPVSFRAEKAVVLMMRSGFFAFISVRINSSLTGSFKLVT